MNSGSTNQPGPCVLIGIYAFPIPLLALIGSRYITNHGINSLLIIPPFPPDFTPSAGFNEFQAKLDVLAVDLGRTILYGLSYG